MTVKLLCKFLAHSLLVLVLSLVLDPGSGWALVREGHCSPALSPDA